MRVFALGLPLLAVSSAVAADGSAISRIEAGIEKSRIANFVPGCAIAVIQDDKVVLLKGFGYRDVARKLPATPDTLFCIGSSSKAFTALLVSQSAQEGKLALTDSPKKLLPEFRLKDADADRRITISDMLSHRSGLPRVDMAWYSGQFGRPELFGILAEAEPTAKLGEKWQYQNLMFMAAGELAGRANGTTYEDLLRQRIFGPLAMTSSNVTYPEAMASSQLAQGYTPTGPLTKDRPVPLRNLDMVAPAGAINSTARDMAQWVRLQLQKGNLDGKQLFAEAAVTDTWKPRMEIAPGSGMQYGYGWMIRKWNDLTLIEHGGNIDGYNAQVAFLPEQKVGLAILTNVSASPLASNAIDIVFNELVPRPKKEAAKGEFKAVEATELGEFELPNTPLKLSFAMSNGRLIMTQGPAKIPLDLIADKTYTANVPGVPKFTLLFRPAAKDPKGTELYLEQGGQKLTLTRPAPYNAPMSGEELLAKSVQAMGGPEAVRKLRHVVMRYSANMPSDAISMRGVSYARGGNQSAEFAVWYALNHRFATVHSFTDGKVARDDLSFAKGDWKLGNELADAINLANIEADLSPAAYYRSLKVIREDKVGGDEVYVLEKRPLAGSPVLDFVSKKDFRVLKRTLGGTNTEYSDFRTVEGLTIPFRQVIQTPQTGKNIVTFESISFTEPIPNWAFRYVPGKK